METHSLHVGCHFQTPQVHPLLQKKPGWWQRCLRFRSLNTQMGKKVDMKSSVTLYVSLRLICRHMLTFSSRMTSCRFLITSTFSFNSWSSRVDSTRSRLTVHLKNSRVSTWSLWQSFYKTWRLCALTLHAAAVAPVCSAVFHLLVPSVKWSIQNWTNPNLYSCTGFQAAFHSDTDRITKWRKGWLTVIIFSKMTAVCPAASLSSLISLLFSSCRARFFSNRCVTFSEDSGLQKRNG